MPTRAALSLPSFTRQGRKGIMKRLWVKIRTGRDHSLIIVTSHPCSAPAAKTLPCKPNTHLKRGIKDFFPPRMSAGQPVFAFHLAAIEYYRLMHRSAVQELT